jgi:hypothetical protein
MFSLASPYARLGLRPGASVVDVKRAYRTLVMRFHPDRAGETSMVDFLAIQAAYESLERLAPVAPPSPSSPTRDGADASAGATADVAAREPEPRARGTAWAGARWYWEGLLANAAKAARRE